MQLHRGWKKYRGWTTKKNWFFLCWFKGNWGGESRMPKFISHWEKAGLSQYTKLYNACRRLILSGLPCLFLFFYSNIILRIFFNILYSNYVVIICFRKLIFVRVYLSYLVVLRTLWYYLLAGSRPTKGFVHARLITRPPLPSWCHRDRPKLAWRTVRPRQSSPKCYCIRPRTLGQVLLHSDIFK